MFRFKVVILIMMGILILGESLYAEATPVKKFTYLNFATISLSYLSWGEKVSLSQGGLTDQAHSNLLGNSLGAEWEHYFEPRYGFILQAAYLFGVADIGGTQSTLPYRLINQPWWGVGASGRFAYRFSKWVISSVGPIGLYRSLTLSNDPSGTVAQSGSAFNVGATIDLRMRLIDQLEVREEIGTLMLNASTYWSFGFGYKF